MRKVKVKEQNVNMEMDTHTRMHTDTHTHTHTHERVRMVVGHSEVKSVFLFQELTNFYAFQTREEKKQSKCFVC